MLRKMYKFIDNYIRGNLKIIGITWSVLLVIFFSIFMFKVVDYTPATNDEYAPLIKQQEQIAQDFNTVYSFNNYSIVPNQNNISITLSNTQCEIICLFNKDFKFINYEKVDLALSEMGAIISSIVLGFILAGTLTIVFTNLLPFIISLLLKLLEKICLLLV